MDRATRLSSLLLALLFASAIGYPRPLAGQAEKAGEDRKVEDAQRKERERQKELERLKAAGVDPKKLDQLRPGVDPNPKPPSAPLKPKTPFAPKQPPGKISLKGEPRTKKPRLIKEMDNAAAAPSSGQSQQSQQPTSQKLSKNDKDKKEASESHHEGGEPHKPELHKHHSGCEALSTQAEVEACKNGKAKQQN